MLLVYFVFIKRIQTSYIICNYIILYFILFIVLNLYIITKEFISYILEYTPGHENVDIYYSYFRHTVRESSGYRSDNYSVAKSSRKSDKYSSEKNYPRFDCFVQFIKL